MLRICAGNQILGPMMIDRTLRKLGKSLGGSINAGISVLFGGGNSGSGPCPLLNETIAKTVFLFLPLPRQNSTQGHRAGDLDR